MPAGLVRPPAELRGILASLLAPETDWHAQGTARCRRGRHVVADILVRPVPLAQPVGGGRLLHVDPIEVTTGGIVCNTGIGLARLGLTVAAAGM